MFVKKNTKTTVCDEIEIYTMISIMGLMRNYDNDKFKVIIFSSVVLFLYITNSSVILRSSHIIFFFFSLIYQRKIYKAEYKNCTVGLTLFTFICSHIFLLNKKIVFSYHKALFTNISFTFRKESTTDTLSAVLFSLHIIVHYHLFLLIRSQRTRVKVKL